MRLSDLFKGDAQVQSKARSAQTGQSSAAQNALMNRQIRALTPGQTLQGEVISKNGNEVQIKISDDFVLSAKLEQNMNIEEGKSLTFQVKNNGSTLTLSPLFTNVATDANIMKALDMASLPVNQNTITMTDEMMKAGLSIDRNSLQQMFREVNAYPDAKSVDLVNLHKLAMPVNEANVNQMASYRNLTHQLINGITNVLDEIPGTIDNMLAEGNVSDASKLCMSLMELASGMEEMAGAGSGTQNVSQSVPQDVSQSISGNVSQNLSQNVSQSMSESVLQNVFSDVSQNVSQNVSQSATGMLLGSMLANVTGGEEALATMAPEDALAEGNVVAKGQDNGQGNTVNNTIQNAAQNTAQGNALQGDAALGNAVSGNVLSGNAVSGDGATAGQIIQNGILQNNTIMQDGEISLSRLADLLNRVSANGHNTKSLESFLKPVLQKLMDQWTISPKDVADAGEVENLYRRLTGQLKNLANALESAGRTDTPIHQAVNNLSQNIDFLQQINQMYTYVQLPLQLQQGNAHGDLYVYTNKKNLAMKDGQISALLHLDMEHLGPVDVYVAMSYEKVNTKFYVADDEMLDFLEQHMDLLTERLKKRGYNCSFQMQVRNSDTGADDAGNLPVGIAGLISQDNHIPLAEYAFDVRT